MWYTFGVRRYLFGRHRPVAIKPIRFTECSIKWNFRFPSIVPNTGRINFVQNGRSYIFQDSVKLIRANNFSDNLRKTSAVKVRKNWMARCRELNKKSGFRYRRMCWWWIYNLWIPHQSNRQTVEWPHWLWPFHRDKLYSAGNHYNWIVKLEIYWLIITL